MSPRKLAKAALFHIRRAQIQTLAVPREMPWLRRRLHLPSNEIFDPLGEVPMHGDRLVRLDPGEQFIRPLPDLRGAPEEASTFFSERSLETTADSYVTEINDAVAWGHPTGGVFTADGRFVPAFTHDPSGANSHTVWTRLSLPAPRPLAGRTLYLVTPEATDNFHHWMIDLLPRLGLVRRAGYQLSEFDHVVVNHAHRRYQLSTLSRLGIELARIVEARDDVWLRCESLVVPSLKANHQTLPAADLAFLRDAFIPEGSSANRTRRIFLSRNDASFRRLTNEKELHPLLRDHDFEIISPGELDVASQARLFAEAAVIAGPAGAAFANLVFASSPARVIEIVSPQWLAAFHWMISARLGLSHTVLVGAGPLMRGIPDASARHADIVAPYEKLSEILAALPAGIRA